MGYAAQGMIDAVRGYKVQPCFAKGMMLWVTRTQGAPGCAVAMRIASHTDYDVALCCTGYAAREPRFLLSHAVYTVCCGGNALDLFPFAFGVTPLLHPQKYPA